MLRLPTLLLLVLAAMACTTVEKSQVRGEWNLYKYESPDAQLQSYMMQHRDEINYNFTDSMAYFRINGRDMYVNTWDLDRNTLVLKSSGSGNPTDWRIVKVDANHLVLKTNNYSIGKRLYEFRR